MAKIAIELKNAVDRRKYLDEESIVRQTDLDKAVADLKDARSAARATKEELRQAGLIADGKPFLLRR